jgi:hypothetical protein
MWWATELLIQQNILYGISIVLINLRLQRAHKLGNHCTWLGYNLGYFLLFPSSLSFSKYLSYPPFHFILSFVFPFPASIFLSFSYYFFSLRVQPSYCSPAFCSGSSWFKLRLGHWIAVVLHDFLQSLQAKSETVPQIRPQWLPFPRFYQLVHIRNQILRVTDCVVT